MRILRSTLAALCHRQGPCEQSISVMREDRTHCQSEDRTVLSYMRSAVGVRKILAHTNHIREPRHRHVARWRGWILVPITDKRE